MSRLSKIQTPYHTRTKTMKPTPTIILGPPGTGKTTRLLGLLQQMIEEGISPEDICFVSFTRKAAQEARDRAKAKFNFEDKDLPNFRTLHSFAFHHLHVDKNQVMGFRSYIDICNMLGLTISTQRTENDENFIKTHTKGDRLFFLENLARSMNRTLDSVWRQFPNDDISFPELELLATTLREYKAARDKMDFTDMIIRFNELKSTPNFHALIVDEAQDMSPIQWDMVDLMSENSTKLIFAGDDDQAIYNWAGADVSRFLALSGDVEVLDYSYRVPKLIHEVAVKISGRIKNRKEKTYNTRNVDGSIVYHTELDTIDMSKGTWLLLARNQHLLMSYCGYCIRNAFLFESKQINRFDPAVIKVIKQWELLRTGARLPVECVRDIYEYMATKTRIKFGSKKQLDQLPDGLEVSIFDLQSNYGLQTTDVWHIALNRIDPEQTQYYISALKRGEKMSVEPRIKISTIHGAKGGEADNVVLYTDMSSRTYEEFEKNPDDEARVWYVAVTRAKHNLHLIQPLTTKFYEF